MYNFNVGEYVFLKKDFDANQANKHLKFDPFFHPAAIIKKNLSENRLLIDHGDRTEIVSMTNVIKKTIKRSFLVLKKCYNLYNSLLCF